MEENSAVSFMMSKMKDIILKNEETSKVLEQSKRDLKESRNQCNEALKDYYQTTVKNLEEAYEESRSQVEKEHDKLREDQEEKEKAIHRCSYALLPEILQLAGSKADGSSLQKCKDILASNQEAIEMSDANHKQVFNFIPNPKLRKLKLGFLQLCDNQPSDFTLRILSPVTCLTIGNQICCGIEGKLTKENLQHLEFCIRRETCIISAKMHVDENNIVTFAFCPEDGGVYNAMACLFGQHIANSPLSLVVTSTNQDSSRTTISPIDKVMDCDSSTLSPSLPRSSPPSHLDVIGFLKKGPEKLEDEPLDGAYEVSSSGDNNNAFAKAEDHLTDVKWKVGDWCIARWEEDEVWYNAEIKQVQPGGHVVATFVDYGNSDVVTRLVNDFAALPISETYDENVTPTGGKDRNQNEYNVEEEANEHGTPNEKEDEKLIIVEDISLAESNFSIGDVCIARWGEDGVWYNGKVEMINSDGTYLINFTDYGNSAVVCRPSIVSTGADIPKEIPKEEIDENVNNNVPKIGSTTYSEIGDVFIPSVGDICVARWDDDCVWYNAKVEALNKDGSFMVNFINYGNTEMVCSPYIVKSASNIPKEIPKENIDEYVNSLKTEQILAKDNKEEVQNVRSELTVEMTDVNKTESLFFSVGDTCVAKWAEDDVWYNAVITSVQSNESYAVMFSDYGNTATIISSNILKNATAIPEHTTIDHIDEHVNMIKTSFKDMSKEKPSKVFSVGESCIARWDQDLVWYNGKIMDINEDGSFAVNFVDYGNSEIVHLPFIVKDSAEVPDSVLNGQIDENVDTKMRNKEPQPDETKATKNVLQTKVEMSSTFSVGDLCVARWTEDLVWYNGKIIDKNIDGSFGVTFVDYGNTEIVEGPFIVHKCSDIPEYVTKDEIDENVRREEGEYVPAEDTKKMMAPNETQVVEKTPEQQIKGREKSTPAVPRPLKQMPSTEALQTKETVEKRPDQVETNKWQPGDICLAQWNDDSIWYNAVVEKRNGNGSYTVRFYDYGNVEEVQPECIVLNHVELLIKENQSIIDKNVKVDFVKDLVQSFEEIANGSSSRTPVELQAGEDVWVVGDKCIAMWAEDDVWYNARIEEAIKDGLFTVKFVDYGNSDVIRQPFIVKQVSQITQNDPILDENVVRKGKIVEFEKVSSKPEFDSNVANNNGLDSHSHTDSFQKVKSPEAEMIKSLLTPEQVRIMNGTSVITSLNFLKFVTDMPNGTRQLPIKKMLQISQNVKEPIGIAILQNKNIVIASTGDDSVKIFNQSGKVITLVQSGRLFKRPSDMVTLSSGQFVVRDDVGLQLFSEEGAFIRNLGQNQIDRCYGVTEDEKGRIVTINGVRPSNRSKPGEKGRGGITDVGETDIFYIDQKSGEVVKRIELVDIVQDKTKSKCRFLNYFSGTVYIVDLGLDCVYTLKTDGDHAEMFGSSGSGPGQFSDPAGLVLDDYGNMIVADSRNHRLQIFNSKNEYVGNVKVDVPLRRPSGIYLDKKHGELCVLNYWGNSMVKYRIG